MNDKNFIVKNQFGELIYNSPIELSKREKELLDYAIASYCFIMFPVRAFTFGQLADRIKSVYDLNNPKNETYYAILLKVDRITNH